MGWFDHHEDEYNQVANAGHKAQLSHELIAAAAAYEAEKAYAKHCEAHGKPASHDKAKEILAGLSAAFVDRIVETKGLDFVDKEKAKHEANKKLHHASAADY